MSSPALIRTQVEMRLASRVPAAFARHVRPEKPAIRTGIEGLDAEIGGIPCGAITEIVSPTRASSGKTSLQNRLLACATQSSVGALIDAADSFDPQSAEAAGVNLKRLLWVRCSATGLKALEQAFKCADLLIQGSSGFRLILIDIDDIAERHVRKVPLTTWFLFRSVAERLETALVFSTPCAVTSTCTALRLTLASAQLKWSQPTQSNATHTRLFAGFDFAPEAEQKQPPKKPVESASPVISASPKWA